MIEVREITKKFGAVAAVNGISFDMKPGEVVGFLGPNGAGKTTTMRILTGYLPPSSGTCLIDGLDITTDSLAIRKKIGYLPESNPLYPDMEVLDYLHYVASLRSLAPQSFIKGAKEVTQVCGLREVLDLKIGTLSKGFRQRVGLAAALLHEPDVLILDEPTVGLDPNQIVEIRDLIRSIGRQKTILLSSHILSEVEQTCERVLIISKGKIVAQGTPRELSSRASGVQIYHAAMRANRSSLESALSQLPGFKNWNPKKEEGDVIYFNVELARGDDRREELFKLAVDQRFGLLELGRIDANLESVFKELTQAPK